MAMESEQEVSHEQPPKKTKVSSTSAAPTAQKSSTPANRTQGASKAANTHIPSSVSTSNGRHGAVPVGSTKKTAAAPIVLVSAATKSAAAAAPIATEKTTSQPPVPSRKAVVRTEEEEDRFREATYGPDIIDVDEPGIGGNTSEPNSNDEGSGAESGEGEEEEEPEEDAEAELSECFYFDTDTYHLHTSIVVRAS